jgi:hypothetical protein
MKIDFNDLYQCTVTKTNDKVIMEMTHDEYVRFQQNFDNFLLLIYCCKHNNFVRDQADKLYTYCKFYNL